MEQPRLDVLICTIHADGLRRVASMVLPREHGVRYIVSWQMPGGERFTEMPLPEALRRDDVVIHRHDTRGLSRNRNEALRVATAPYVLIADDDLAYIPGALTRIIGRFDADPGLDVMQLMYEPCEKAYPSGEVRLGLPLPRGLYVTSVEMAMRRGSVAGRLCFNEDFGIGSRRFGCGEDPLFMHTALRMGLNCRFIPITIARHDGPTTGDRSLSAASAAGEGALIAVQYGIAGMPRVPLFVWRRRRRGLLGLRTGLWHVARGYLYGLMHRRDIERGSTPEQM